MKRIFCIAIISAGILSCQSNKQDAHDHDHHEHHGDSEEWAQMDEFHMIMAETFHPYKDSANLEPAKAQASELMNAAAEWAAEPLPAKVDNDRMRTLLQDLKKQAEELSASVTAQDDDLIGDKLNTLHDTFHEIQEAWYGGQ